MGITKFLSKTWLTLTFLLFTAVFLVSSGSLSPVASTVPRAISLVTLVLLLIHLARVLRSREDQPYDNGKGKLVVILWVSTLPLAVMAVGITAGCTLFSLVFLKAYAKETWMSSLLLSLSVGAGLHMLSLLTV